MKNIFYNFIVGAIMFTSEAHAKDFHVAIYSTSPAITLFSSIPTDLAPEKLQAIKDGDTDYATSGNVGRCYQDEHLIVRQSGETKKAACDRHYKQ